MNRAERRKQHKELPRYRRLNTDDQIKERLVRNGITTKDLEDNYRRGCQQGYADGLHDTIHTVYAAVCLALHDEFGFGHTRCLRALQRVDEHVLNTLVSAEAIEKVWQDMQIAINFKEPFDRMEETT